MIIWDYSHPQYNASLDKLNSILHRNRVNIFPKCGFLNYFSYLCTRKRASLLTLGHQCKHHGPRLTADLSAERLRNCSRSAIDALQRHTLHLQVREASLLSLNRSFGPRIFN